MREDWVECTFEDLSLTLKRGPFGGDLKKAFFVDTGFPVYEQQHAINNNFTNIRYYIDEDRYNKLKSCNVGPGDYIVSCSGTMGKIARLPDSAIVGVINQALLRIRINEKIITNDYFLLFFRSNMFQKEILKDSRGSGMQNMAGIKEIKPVKLNLPPLPIQRAIVKKIESLFAHLDSGIADLEKAQAQLKIYRQAVLKKAFEGALTKEWRAKQTDLPTAVELLEQIKTERKKHYEQQLTDWKKAVEIWEENGKKGKKPGKPKKYKELEDLIESEIKDSINLPSSWKWVKIGQLFLSLDQGWSPRCENVPSKNEEWGVIKTTAIQANSFEPLNNKKLPNNLIPKVQHELKAGDILITRAGPRKRVGVCCYVKRVRTRLINCDKAYRIRTCLINPEYISYLLNSPKFTKEMEKTKSGINDSGVNLKQDIFLKMQVPLLSLKEQHQIVQKIETRLSVCDNVEATLTASLEKSKALRQSILKKAFEGKLLDAEEIEACKAEADYEPASVLLEKKKLEKNK